MAALVAHQVALIFLPDVVALLEADLVTQISSITILMVLFIVVGLHHLVVQELEEQIITEFRNL